MVVLSACGQGINPETDDQSTLHFLNNWDSGIALEHMREPEFRICTRGATSSSTDDRAIRSVLIWLKAARIADGKVTKNVKISCNKAHLNIEMIAGRGRSMGGPSSLMYYTGQAMGELVHELGHALVGLGDTYAGGAGVCKAGQPQSNMCWGAYGPRSDMQKYSGLWPDDIEGVQRKVKRLFRDAIPPANASAINAEEPLLDANNPWPEVTNGGGGSVSPPSNLLFAALEDSSTSSMRVFISTPQTARGVILCPSQVDFRTCSQSTDRIELTQSRTVGDRLIWSTPRAVNLNNGTILSGFATNDTKQSLGQTIFKVTEK